MPSELYDSGAAGATVYGSPPSPVQEPDEADALRLDRRHVWHPMLQHADLERHPLRLITRGEGHRLTDHDGRVYLDAMAGLWCVNVGYGRREIVDAVARQMERLAYYPHTQANVPAARLAARLARLLNVGAAPSGLAENKSATGSRRLTRTYFVNSGSEANEAAFKIARQYALQRHPGQRRYKVIGRRFAYHGTTMATLAAGGMAPRTERFEPLPTGFVHVAAPYCYRCPFGLSYPTCGVACAHEVEHTIEAEGPETVAAVVLEPIQSGVGVLVPPDEYLPIVAEACRRHGVLLIADEVINGFGRTGRPFGFRWYGVEPDLVTMAKGLTSAYLPLGAVTATDEVFGAFLSPPNNDRAADSECASGDEHVWGPREAVQVNTFGGHAAACAAALANLDILEREDLAKNALETGSYLLEELRRLRMFEMVGDIRGKGLLLAVELVRDRVSREPLDEPSAARVVADCLDAGVIVGRTARTRAGGGNTITLAPPLTWRHGDADVLVHTLERALRRLEGGP